MYISSIPYVLCIYVCKSTLPGSQANLVEMRDILGGGGTGIMREGNFRAKYREN